MQFPAKAKFLLEVFLSIICVSVEGGTLEKQAFQTTTTKLKPSKAK